MPPLNPYLRAFFKSNIPSQCKPVHDHVLLVPTTDCLLNSKDGESGSLFTDIAGTDEFLASHVLRIPTSQSLQGDGMRIGGRETRAKPRQFSTVNGRTVIVRDSWVHSKSGFRNHRQAQILNSMLYSPDVIEPQQWLIYFISKPLIGSVEKIHLLPQPSQKVSSPPQSSTISEFGRSKKKDIGSFQELMANYPMIQRQLQPGLNQVLLALEEELLRAPTGWKPANGSELEDPDADVDAQDLLSDSGSYAGSEDGDEGTGLLNGHPNGRSSISQSKQVSEEFHLRKAFETAIAEATQLFQRIDSTQMDLLVNSTSLTDIDIDRLLEKYIAEQVHDHILFPRLRASKEAEDLALTTKIIQMRHIDMSQVGIPAVSQAGKASLAKRLTKGIEEFRKLTVARSPQAAVQIMLKAARALTAGDPVLPGGEEKADEDEKASIVTINADMLVSLLLLVVIRARVPNLMARLAYMKTFVLADDVEAGETGYVLSTFEAVLYHIAQDSDGLEAASKANGELWMAVKQGDLATVKRILHPEKESNGYPTEYEVELKETPIANGTNGVEERSTEMNGDFVEGEKKGKSAVERETEVEMEDSETGKAEVTPFYGNSTTATASRTSLSRSLHSSVTSLAALSRTYSRNSEHMDIASPSKLARARNLQGDSILMMAIHQRQPEVLSYLLHSEHFPPEVILEDTNSNGGTILSAAIQDGDYEVVDVILDRLVDIRESGINISKYLNKPDIAGRAAAHYLFNTPNIILHLGQILSWTQKDKNGQTPLFALFRSYDHSQYREMAEAALRAAKGAQRDQQPLHVEQHVDGKGNTLLHVASDTTLLARLLAEDVDVNAVNDRGFTPIMVASKYGRTEAVKVLFRDRRVDLQIRENRGLTAVELAKDDEVRNAIDGIITVAVPLRGEGANMSLSDLVFLENPPNAEGHIVAAVRTFFVDDASIRFVIKMGTPNHDHSTITIRTCRRSLTDFQFIAKWLAYENPASWLPVVPEMRSPYQLPSKPSRAVLQEMQNRVDFFLRALLDHPTFQTHELLWEFFVVPDVQTDAAIERSKKKAEARLEKIREEYAPIEDMREVDIFVNFAKDTLRSVHYSYRSLVRRINTSITTHQDLEVATSLLPPTFSESITFLPPRYLTALTRLCATYAVAPSHPYITFLADMHNISSSMQSFLTSLDYSKSLISQVSSLNSQISKLRVQALNRTKKPSLPFGILDESRAKSTQRDESHLVQKRQEVEDKLRELRWTNQVAAGELAGFEKWRGEYVKERLKVLARGMVVREKERLESMKRALRALDDGGRDGQRWRDLTARDEWDMRGRRRERELPPLPDEDEEVVDCTALPGEQVEMVKKLDRLFDL